MDSGSWRERLSLSQTRLLLLAAAAFLCFLRRRPVKASTAGSRVRSLLAAVSPSFFSSDERTEITRRTELTESVVSRPLALFFGCGGRTSAVTDHTSEKRVRQTLVIGSTGPVAAGSES